MSEVISTTIEKGWMYVYETKSLNAAMGARRMTNRQLAAAAGVSIRSVSDVRNGKRNVTLRTITAIAGAAGLDVELRFTQRPPSEAEEAI